MTNNFPCIVVCEVCTIQLLAAVSYQQVQWYKTKVCLQQVEENSKQIGM